MRGPCAWFCVYNYQSRDLTASSHQLPETGTTHTSQGEHTEQLTFN